MMGNRTIISLIIVFALSMVSLAYGGQNFEKGKVWEVKSGDDYRAVLNRLKPGDEMVLHEGIYEGAAIIINSGLINKKITIRGFGQGQNRPILSLENRGNLVQINASNIVLDYLEFRSKYGYSIRIGTSKDHYSYNNITIKNCIFRECGGGDISANSSPHYDNIQILDNYFIGSQKTPVYIGIHDGKSRVTNFVFKGNVIDGTGIFGNDITGYGIQLKLNVTGGKIENNFITGTKGPGIMIYGAEDSNPANANIVRNNIVLGSRNSAGIVIGGGPSVVEGNITFQCNGGISVQNYANRNLLHQIKINKNTSISDHNYGMSYGNVPEIIARKNHVITLIKDKAYVNNPNPGKKNMISKTTTSLDNVVSGNILENLPERNNLNKIWEMISSGPFNQKEVEKLVQLITEYNIHL